MTRFRDRRRVLLALAGIAVLCGVSATRIFAANHTTTIHVGNLILRAGGEISPQALPKNKLTPVTVRVHGSVATADGSHPPPALKVRDQVDRHFRIDSNGLPTCKLGRIEVTSPTNAMKACGSALIGKGHATAQVEFNEQLPFSATGPMLAFNGPRSGGHPEMFFYVYVAVPAPTALVAVAKVSKDSGKYSYRISLAVPEVAHGSGSLTSFEMTLGREWTYKGRQHSYLEADCPTGSFFNQIEAWFGDGTYLNGAVVNKCRPKG